MSPYTVPVASRMPMKSPAPMGVVEAGTARFGLLHVTILLRAGKHPLSESELQKLAGGECGR